jgi:hypothetical protein
LFERRLSPVARLFLATGVAVPVGRTLLPGMVDFNGVRHFLEFYPFLAALGGAGLALLVRKLAGLGRVGVVAAAGAVALTLAPGALATARTNPNGICYFNALVGGLSGARERGLFGAVDYWGNSYWQGLRWVAEDAPSGARVLALAAEWIALASGPVLLPPEVEFWRVGDAEPEGPLYVVSLLTDAWSGPTQLRIDRSREAEHEILVQGAPILRVHRLSAMAEIGEVLACWRAEAVARAAIERGWEWLEANPEFAPHLYVPLSTYGREGPEAALAQVKLILPETLHEGLAEALWYQMSLLSPTAPSLPPLPPE